MIALYPGAFKPPHRGHFNVVKSLLDGSYNGTIYNKDDYKDKAASLFNGEAKGKPTISKVVIFIGGGERNGIDKQESEAIWNIYKKHLGNVEIVDGQKNPMFAAKDYARENPNEDFVAVTGLRGEKDFVDLRRVTTFSNVDNVQGLALKSAPGSEVRATDFRKNILSGNLDQITDFFPKSLSREEILNILTGLKDKIVAELLASNIGGFVESYFDKSVLAEEPVAIRSVDRNRLSNLYNYLSNLLPLGASIELIGDKINIGYENNIQEQQTRPELKEYIASLLEYMLDNKMNITPLPEVKIRKDEAEAANFFGKTAYYDPNNREIVLYTSGRHNKDIVRSFSHEMVHHIQNMEGRLGKISTSNTNEDDSLLELEKEAYLVGNITFRNWEDGLKNNTHNLNEGRYDSITTKLSSIAFQAFKDAYDRGDKKAEFEFRVGHPEDPETDIPSTQFETDFLGIARFNNDTYKVDGGANAGIDDDGEEIQPMLHLNFDIPKDPNWQEISMDIKDVVRHELEHLTQDGENLRQGKYIPDDQDLRNLMDAGLLDKDLYFELEKEVDAMLQGLYYKAKKSKQPFAKVVDDYLNKAMISLDNKEKVLILWRKRLPALGIKQRL